MKYETVQYALELSTSKLRLYSDGWRNATNSYDARVSEREFKRRLRQVNRFKAWVNEYVARIETAVNDLRRAKEQANERAEKAEQELDKECKPRLLEALDLAEHWKLWAARLDDVLQQVECAVANGQAWCPWCGNMGEAKYDYETNQMKFLGIHRPDCKRQVVIGGGVIIKEDT